MDNLYSQINSEINMNVLKFCRLISKNFNITDSKELYKLWVDTLPKEVTEDTEKEKKISFENDE